LEYFKQFTIPYKNLSDGNYQYIFIIDELFFENCEIKDIQKGRIDVEVRMEKSATMLQFLYKLKGNAEVMCDRCLEQFKLPIDSDFRMNVKFGTERKEQTDEILIVPETDNEINLMQYIYEYIYLSLPIQRIHPDNKDGNSQCNALIIEKLNELSGKGINEKEMDPRWEVLKNIKLN